MPLNTFIGKPADQAFQLTFRRVARISAMWSILCSVSITRLTCPETVTANEAGFFRPADPASFRPRNLRKLDRTSPTRASRLHSPRFALVSISVAQVIRPADDVRAFDATALVLRQ